MSGPNAVVVFFGVVSFVFTAHSTSECATEIFVSLQNAEVVGFQIDREPQTLEIDGVSHYGFFYRIHLPKDLDKSGGYFSADLSENALRSRDSPEHNPPDYFFLEADIRKYVSLSQPVAAAPGVRRISISVYLKNLVHLPETVWEL